MKHVVVCVFFVLHACTGSSHASSKLSSESRTSSVRNGWSTQRLNRGLQLPQSTGVTPVEPGNPVSSALAGRPNDEFGRDYDYDVSGMGGAGKGKGVMPPLQSDDYYIPYLPGKGKGGIGKSKGGVQYPQPPGKGKGSTSDYTSYPLVGKGAVGKGKGWMPPQLDNDDDYYYGGIGKGKGGFNDYPSYPSVGKGAVGKGKGWMPPQQDDDFYYGTGKGKGSSIHCSTPYLSYGSIPDNMWLDQNGCLHHLPPAPPIPSMEPMPAGSLLPRPTLSPVVQTSQPATSLIPTMRPTVSNPIPTLLTLAPSRQVPSATDIPSSGSTPTTAPTPSNSGPPAPSVSPAGEPSPSSLLSPTLVPSPSSPETISPSPSSSQTAPPSAIGSGTVIPSSPSSATSSPTSIGPSTIAPSGTGTTTFRPTPRGTTERPSGDIVAGPTVDATPFSVTYTLNPVADPSQGNFETAADLTSAYLQSYIEAFFSKTPFSILINFSGTPTGNSGSGDPASIGFEVTTVFSDDSDVLPSQTDIDVLIDTALSEPAVFDLINQLEALGVDNPFSSTQSVEYSTDNVPTSFSSSTSSKASSSTAALLGAMAAVCLVIFSASTFIAIRRRRHKWLRHQHSGYEEWGRGTKASDISTRNEETPSSSGARTVCSGALEILSCNDSSGVSSAASLNSTALFEEATEVE